jgi:hypothetical protein
MDQTRTRYKLAVMGRSHHGSKPVDIVKECLSLEMKNFEHIKNLIISPHNFLPSIVSLHMEYRRLSEDFIWVITEEGC